MVQMVEYEVENDLVWFDFEILSFLFVFYKLFRVSQQGMSVSELSAALRRPQKKQAPGFWSLYFVDFVFF